MSSRNLSLSMKLYADTAKFVSGLVSGERGVRNFTGGIKREFEALKGAMNSVEGKLASVGVSVGAVATIIQSARMDKSLSQIGQTAGASEADVAGLRAELFRMSSETGQNVDDLQQGFNNAVQSGLQFREALPVLDAVNKTMAVTGANADSLIGSLTVAGTAFDFDLAKPQMAATLLDKMTVAGRLGNAELESLSSIFSRVGPNAAAAGFGFDKTLAFIEGLSQIERQPERLATLVDSTLRLFTNLKYMKDAQKATGVKFFDADGSRRDGMAVLADLRKQYEKLGTEKERALYVQKAFGNTDLETVKGMRVVLSGDMLGNINGFFNQIDKAGGSIARDLPAAISNAVDQTGRLKNELRSAADSFAQPINDTIQKLIKLSLDKKEQGGFGLDGKDILLGTAIGIPAVYAGSKFGGKAFNALANRFGGTAAGVAEGKALEQAAGVTPVYVVNMPKGVFESAAGVSSHDLPAGGPAKTVLKDVVTNGGAVAAAGAAGYGAGTLMYNAIEGTAIADAVGRTVAVFLAPISSAAREALATEFKNKAADLSGTLNIKIDQDGRVSSASVKTNQKAMDVNVYAGRNMLTAQ
jgi:hypothetical protein